MSDKPGPSKRLSSMPDRAKKRLKSTDVEELLLDSDDDIYAGSDVDDRDYDFGDSEISVERK
ncbi:uncharacterized protein LOC105181649 isoform X2 [Harpegnathos saltator]|uniref:uncharacterized protein LOC105181649 isoform X2 n=1 Tax=Harpegnathos saltator TaxID=610380 RepID=UPI0005900434|nr:uncharacterized protein LOC105181649 isoform X2 [Harpegnathos saltator]